MGQTYEHYVLCVLSNIMLGKDNVPLTMEDVRGKTKTYSLDEGGTHLEFLGMQTNEAPVKCLVQLGLNEGNPVTKIVCLTSSLCKKPAIQSDDKLLSAKDWFEQSIQRYYSEQCGLVGDENLASRVGFFCHLDYDAVNPSNNLKAITDALSTDALIDIDTTGGPRDAAFLLTTVVQFFEAKYGVRAGQAGDAGPSVGLGRTVYSNFREGKLHLQNETFAINNLIHAVTSFTKYGRADALVGYFDRKTTGTPTSDEMKALCRAASAFADDLALCRTYNINEDVDAVHDALKEFMSKTKSKSEKHQKITELMNDIDSSKGTDDLADLKVKTFAVLVEVLGLKGKKTDEQQKATVAVSDPRWNALFAARPQFVDTETQKIDDEVQKCKSKEDLKNLLRREDKKWLVRRGELLFFTVADNLKQDIPKGVADNLTDAERNREKGKQTLAIIRWCVNRGMMLQALAMFKELIPDCLGHLGIVEWRGSLAESSKKRDRVSCLVNLAYANRENPHCRLDKVRSLGVHLANELDTYGANAGLPSRLTNLRYDTKAKTQEPYHSYEQAISIAFPAISANPQVVWINNEDCLRLALMYYRVINPIRNDVIHVQEDGDGCLDYCLRDCGLLVRDFDPERFKFDSSASSLQALLLSAISDIELGKTLMLKDEVASAYDAWGSARKGHSYMASVASNSYCMQAPSPGTNPRNVLQLIRSMILNQGLASVELVGTAGWKEVNVLVQADPDLTFENGLRIVGQASEMPKNLASMDSETIDACKGARDAILRVGGNADITFVSDLRDAIEPFNSSRACELLSAMPPKKASGIAQKLARNYPGTFQAVRCVRKARPKLS